MTHITGHDRSQTLLLPESLDDYVGPENPVRFVDEFVGSPAGPALCVTLLGPMRAHDADGNDVLPRLRKTRAVLAILALATPQPVLRSHLIHLLWRRPNQLQALGSLRQALLELKAALGPATRLLHIQRWHIALSGTGLQVDAVQVVGDRLMPGPLLSDLDGVSPEFDQWLSKQRRGLTQRVLNRAKTSLTEAIGPAETEAAAEQLLAIDPINEGAWRALISAHTSRCQGAAALAAFERCRAVLFERCRIDPSPETTALLTNMRAAPVAGRKASRRERSGTSVRLDVATLRGRAADGTVELAVALTEELIVALSRFHWLVCALCTTDRPKHDADFLLEGTLGRSGDRLRVSLSLIDVRSRNEIVWAEHFDNDIVDILAVQDWLAGTAAARIELRLWHWKAKRTGEQDTTPRTPRDLVHMAVPAVYRLDRAPFMTAGQWLDRAVELNPDDASAHAWAVQWYLHCVGQGWAADPVAGIQRAQNLAERAILLDPEDARVLTLNGHVHAFLDHRPDEALRLHERAIAANPNLPLSWCLSGLAYSYVGECAEGIRRLRYAQALSPCDPFDFFNESGLSISNLLCGEYEAAAAAGQRAIALNPDFSASRKAYLAAMGHIRSDDTAASSLAKLHQLEPGFSVEQAMRRSPFATAEGRAIFAEGLRAAGLPTA
jgi:DNA-binding SARP family transcriptional activator